MVLLVHICFHNSKYLENYKKENHFLRFYDKIRQKELKCVYLLIKSYFSMILYNLINYLS